MKERNGCRSVPLANTNEDDMNLELTKNTKATRQPPMTLADVAFLDITDVCAAARMSASWIHEEVRAGRFPQPMRFGPRCSRWRSADVRDWLIGRASAAERDADAAAPASIVRAKKASDAAQAKRRAIGGL